MHMRVSSCHRAKRIGAGNQSGIALITVMLVMIIMTALGIAALTRTGMEGRMAGFVRSGEASSVAAESCLGTSVNIIQQTILNSELDQATYETPNGPVTDTATLFQEIIGKLDNNADTSAGTPNITRTMNNFTVNGDIDRLYAKAVAGGSLEFAAGSEGTGGAAAIELIYRIDCVADNAATGTSTGLSAVYSCLATGGGCQKKL